MFKYIKQWRAVWILRRGGPLWLLEDQVEVLQKVRAVKPLIAILQEANGHVRGKAAEALGRIGDARAIAPLIAILQDKEAYIRRTAVGALVRINKPAVESLIAVLQEANEHVRGAAAEALGKIADVRAVTPLIKSAREDQQIAEIGITALQGILTHAAAGITPKDLDAVTNLYDVVQIRKSTLSCGGEREWESRIDCAYIRQLARQELIRRGLKA